MSALATAGPVVPAPVRMPMGTMDTAVYPPGDQEFVQRTQRASERFQRAMDAYPSVSPHSSKMDSIAINEALPPVLPEGGQSWRPRPDQRPRRVSSSSTTSTATTAVSGYGSFDGRLRGLSGSTSSLTSFESSPSRSAGSSLPSTPTYAQYQLQNGYGGGAPYYAWQRPAPVKAAQRRKANPGELFAALPGEVLELILEELRKLHLQPGRNSCATCWMRDCCSVALSARKFVKYARVALYENIQLVGGEGPNMKKRTKLSYGSRMVSLRRTLRANAQVAVIVRSLKVPALPPGATTEDYNDLVASVVMACPNFERLLGFYPTYNHSFQRLFHALSTRPRLKEMNWMLEPSPFQRQHRMRPSGGNKNHLWAPGDLQPQQSRAFVEFHLRWKHLTTLVVHCQPGATLTPDRLLGDTFRYLPGLQNLHLSRLPHTSFHDANLLILPRGLKKLSLSHLPGVTTAGLSSWATRSSSASIATLTLNHMNVETLPALARIFSNLTSLETFNLVQAYAPVMPTDELIMLFPYLASQSLRKLHWDIPYLPTRASTADNILARSISAGGFPALRVLRVPNDPEGVFQVLCHPRERIESPTDRYRRGNAHLFCHARTGSSYSHSQTGSIGNSSSSNSGSGSGNSGRSGSGLGGGRRGSTTTNTSPPTSPLFPPDALMMPRDNSDLHQSRVAAQARLEAAQRSPRFFVNLINEDGVVVEKHGVGAFLGSVESKINYVLTPDAGATDEGGGLVGISDLLGDCGEDLVIRPRDKDGRISSSGGSSGSNKKDGKKGDPPTNPSELQTREGCIGRWNTYSGAVIDKKDRERWWHAERGRWRGAVLS
ncbi:hypothetical protein QBC46DRAFT_170645 [Diplogelasinospora grovesii]|uniref:Uncharacterized protein n=1 Tax=Diplogelasinospora grovesii TaxID=303347 RepID=A0AAN6N3T9_9PEZI|nr:hypothetical protein QBC46DRAFT_170645 [Diplogelasinospora grovesii]